MSIKPALVTDGPPPGLKAQVMSALRWSAIAKFGGQLLSWGITLMVIRLLAPADYGLVAMLSVIFMFLGMLGEMGFGASIAQSSQVDESEIRHTLGAALVVNVAICLLLIAAAPAIGDFYGESRLIPMTRIAALTFLALGICPIYNGLLQREMRFKASARIDILCGLAQNLAILYFAWRGFGAWALIYGGLITAPLKAVMLCASATRLYWPAFGIKGTRRIWSFSGNLLVTRLVWMWSSQVDVLIAAKFLGKEALGFYTVAVHLASLPMQRAAGIINGVAFAAFARIQDDRAAVTANTRLSIRLMALVTFPLLWGIAAVSPELVDIVLGDKWLPAVFPLTLVALTIPLRMIGSVVSTTIMSMGRVDIAMITTVIAACLAPPIFYIGSRYGIVGLSLAWLVITPIMFGLNMFRALPILGLGMRDVAVEIWRPVVIAGVMFGAVDLAREVCTGWPSVALFATLVLVGSVVYCGGCWLLNRTASIEALVLLFPGRFARWGVSPVPAR